MTTHEAADLTTHGWAPGTTVSFYYAAQQEPRRVLNAPPVYTSRGALAAIASTALFANSSSRAA